MESFEDMLIRHEGIRHTPYIDSVGIQTIGLNVLPSFVMDNPINQHVAHSILSSETSLRFAFSVAMSNVSDLIFCQFSHWSRRSLLAFLQTILISVKLVVTLSGILKILKRIIQFVPVAVVYGIDLVAGAYKRLSDKSMDCCFYDSLLTVRHLRKGYAQVSCIADKRALESIGFAPTRSNVHNAPFRTDCIQSLVPYNRLPYFHSEASCGIV